MAVEALRTAAPDDVADLVGVFRRSRTAAMPWLPALHSLDEDLAFFGGQVANQQAWVVDRDGTIEAFAIAAAGWLNHLYVEPDRRGHGLGTRLVEQVQQAFPDGLQLWVFQRNVAARRFYAARGFREVETTDGSGNEERTPDVRMRWDGSVADLAAHGV
jgi:GNAT superfamily N-acetyltransferase